MAHSASTEPDEHPYCEVCDTFIEDGECGCQQDYQEEKDFY